MEINMEENKQRFLALVSECAAGRRRCVRQIPMAMLPHMADMLASHIDEAERGE